MHLQPNLTEMRRQAIGVKTNGKVQNKCMECREAKRSK